MHQTRTLPCIEMLTEPRLQNLEQASLRQDHKTEVVQPRPTITELCLAYAGNGEEKTSLLLLSGWWGVARHFHYVPEIMASVFWTLPAMFEHAAPWSYSMFLTALLVDRITRDDTRCRSKYGKYWDKYCERVQYKMIPFVF